MNEFQYNGTPQEQAMADLLKSQSHRLARQQIVFALIFLLVIVLAAYYIVTRMIWATFDVYIPSMKTVSVPLTTSISLR